MRLRWLVIAVCAVLFVGGVAYAGMQWLGDTPEHDALELAPPDSAFYANAFLDPSMDQKMALKSLLAKLPRYDTPGEASKAVTSLFDESLGEVGLSFEADVRPWLGDQVAAFASPEGLGGTQKGSFGLLLAAEDTDAALDAISTGVAQANKSFTAQSYKGVDYRVDAGEGSAIGVVESFVVAGNEAGFKAAVDASTGESLSGSAKYRKATEGLTVDRVALFYYDAGGALRSLQNRGVGSLGAVAPLGSGLPQEPGAAVLFARADGLVLEASTPLPPDAGPGFSASAGEPGLVPALPRDSWAALGVAEFGEVLRNLIDGFGAGMGDAGMLRQQFSAQTGLDLDKDVLGWMGDLGLSVEGTTMTELSGGVVIESEAPEISSATVASIGRLAAREGAPVKPLELGNSKGFSIADPSMPQAINVVAGGDRVVIAYGDNSTRELLDPEATLSEEPRFRAAAASLGEDFNPTGFVNVPVLVDFAESMAGAPDPRYEEIEPFVDAVSYVVLGARVEGDTVVQRVVIGID